MAQTSRSRYPDFDEFNVLGQLGNKLLKLSPREKHRIESLLANLRVNWGSDVFERFPQQDRLRSAYVNLHELYLVMKFLSQEMTTRPPES